jgi:hypothetical protein
MALTGDGGSGDGLNLPRTDEETMQDPRTDLERLPSGNLYGVARNAASVHRQLAIQLLVERASPFAGRDEIAAEEIVPSCLQVQLNGAQYPVCVISEAGALFGPDITLYVSTNRRVDRRIVRPD